MRRHVVLGLLVISIAGCKHMGGFGSGFGHLASGFGHAASGIAHLAPHLAGEAAGAVARSAPAIGRGVATTTAVAAQVGQAALETEALAQVRDDNADVPTPDDVPVLGFDPCTDYPLGSDPADCGR